MGSTLHRLNYRLRPAKNIERKMLCEAFARLSRISALPSYRYIGFGSLGFCDFTLFHQRLGICDMISIEALDSAKDRVTFNKPYDCIELRWGTSHTELPKLDWSARTIVWLDYDGALDEAKLADISLITAKVRSGSVVLVTVPADPGDASDVNVGKRLRKLKKAVGDEKVPDEVSASDLKDWGMAKVCQRIISNEILSTLQKRNGPASMNSRIAYLPLFNIHYADGTKMLTTGGLFVNAEERAKLSSDHFSDLDFISTTQTPYVIDAPYLTRREMRYLDERLPSAKLQSSEPVWLEKSLREQYAKIYRYYPDFSEVET